MKTLALILFLFSSVACLAQVPEDTLVKVRDSITVIDTVSIDGLSTRSDSLLLPPVPVRTLKTDTAPTPALNMYGGLVNDDRFYNPRYPLWVPASRVFTAVAFNWAINRY